MNPLGFYRQCSGQKLLAIAVQVAGLNTGDRTLVGLRSLTGQCALIFGEAIEFVIDVKEPLQESAKFTLGLGVQSRLE